MMRPSKMLFVLAAFPCLPTTARAQDPEPAELAPLQPDVAPSAADLERIVGRPGGLTSAQAAKRAMETSPGIERAHAEVLRGEGEVEAARTSWLPRATLTARYTRLSPITQPSFGQPGANLVATTAGTGPLAPGAPLIGTPPIRFPVILNQYWLQANLVVPLSDYLLRVGQSVGSAKASRAASQLQQKAAEREVAYRGRLAYYGWAAARLEQEVAARGVEQSREHVRIVSARAAEGQVLKADELRVQAALARAELVAEQAASRATVAESELRILLHDDERKEYAIGEPLFEPLPPVDASDLSTLERRARKHRPEYSAIAEARHALDERRRVASAARYPRLDAFGNAYYANPNQRYIPMQQAWHATWDVGVQLTWSPNDLLGDSATMTKLDAEHSRLLAEERQLSDSVRQEIRRSTEALRQAEAARSTAARSLTAAEAAYEQRKALFDVGRATAVELLDADNDVLRARLEVIAAAIQARVAQAQLDFAVGRDR
jgi:outer membrane protein TolC